MNKKKTRAEFAESLDRRLSGLQGDPWLTQHIIEKEKGEEPKMKKISTSFIVVIALLVITVSALATTLLWQDAGEKVAPLEGQNGYYDTWNTDAKIELVKVLYDLGELTDHSDAEQLLNGSGMTMDEKDVLCDQIMTAYVHGTPDTVTLLSILETLHGDMSTWPMEDKVWYNELLRKNGMLSKEEENYVLPAIGEIDEEQAVNIAKDFLIGKGITYLEQARIEATMYEETDDVFYGETQIGKAGRRLWSIVFRSNIEGLPYGGVCSAEVLTDGQVTGYHVPELVPLCIYGKLPDDNAIQEDQALDIAGKAIAAQQNIAENDITGMKAFFGYIDHADEQVAHAKLGEYVWAVTTEQGYYALVRPTGDVLYVGNLK